MFSPVLYPQQKEKMACVLLSDLELAIFRRVSLSQRRTGIMRFTLGLNDAVVRFVVLGDKTLPAGFQCIDLLGERDTSGSAIQHAMATQHANRSRRVDLPLRSTDKITDRSTQQPQLNWNPTQVNCRIT